RDFHVTGVQTCALPIYSTAHLLAHAVKELFPDGDLRIGKQLLHRVRKQVRGRMPQDLEALRVTLGDDGDIGVRIDAVAGVDQLAVHLPGERGARQAGADRSGDLGYGDGSWKRLRRAVWETDIGRRAGRCILAR